MIEITLIPALYGGGVINLHITVNICMMLDVMCIYKNALINREVLFVHRSTVRYISDYSHTALRLQSFRVCVRWREMPETVNAM